MTFTVRETRNTSIPSSSWCALFSATIPGTRPTRPAIPASACSTSDSATAAICRRAGAANVPAVLLVKTNIQASPERCRSGQTVAPMARSGERGSMIIEVSSNGRKAKTSEACRSGENLMEPICEAVRRDATVGEICDVYRAEFGIYTDPGWI